MELVLQENPAKTLHRCQLKMFQHLHAHRHFRRCESACAQLAAAAILLLALLRLEERMHIATVVVRHVTEVDRVLKHTKISVGKSTRDLQVRLKVQGELAAS